jgi:hypothetical protein
MWESVTYYYTVKQLMQSNCFLRKLILRTWINMFNHNKLLLDSVVCVCNHAYVFLQCPILSIMVHNSRHFASPNCLKASPTEKLWQFKMNESDLYKPNRSGSVCNLLIYGLLLCNPLTYNLLLCNLLLYFLSPLCLSLFVLRCVLISPRCRSLQVI